VRSTRRARFGTVIAALLVVHFGATHGTLLAHDGPPFPIVSNVVVGSYEVSIWTDPDTTDDGTAGGQFWVTIRMAAGDRADVPASTRVELAISPVSRTGPTRSVVAAPVDGQVSRRFASLVMDHEGLFHVRAIISGPLGSAELDGEVEATYDLRPPPVMILVFVMPFVLVGWLWIRQLLRRRRRVEG